MDKFTKTYLEDLQSDIIKPFEDYSMEIKPINSKVINGKCFKYVNCNNNCIISEDSLSRTLSFIKDKDFAILTAYRSNFSKNENIIRNRKLRAKLNELHMGVHQLVGHWQEAPKGKQYNQCSKKELKDVVERSYLVIKPDDIKFNEFKQFILSLLTIDYETQDAAIIKNNTGIYILYNNGDLELIGKDCNLGKINQAYSQHIKNNLPFVFEGIETPGSNIAREIYNRNNILY